GINTFGIRMRHEVFDTWLTEKRDLNFVVSNLSLVNFDPEFYKKYERSIHAAFQNQLATS
ncbi:MAG: NAD(P)/FAD-dependent oxidoreductase, partial [Flavobacteriaceae bacterium]